MMAGNLRKLLLVALCAMTAHCTRATSGATENKSPTGKKGSEIPGTLPGYLVDDEAFGYAGTTSFLTPILTSPFASIDVDGSFVVPLDRAPSDEIYYVALYGPPAGVTCDAFVSQLTATSGGDEASHRQSRYFDTSPDQVLSADGTELTLVFNLNDERLPCTAMVVAEDLPEDAGYRMYNGNVAFLTVGSEGPEGSEVYQMRFWSTETGAVKSYEFGQATSTIAGMLSLSYLPTREKFIAASRGRDVFERENGTWTSLTSIPFRWSTAGHALGGAAWWEVDGVEQTYLLEQSAAPPYVSLVARSAASSAFENKNIAATAQQIFAPMVAGEGYLAAQYTSSGPKVGVIDLKAAALGPSTSFVNSASPAVNGVSCSSNFLAAMTSLALADGAGQFAVGCRSSGTTDLSVAALVLVRLYEDPQSNGSVTIVDYNQDLSISRFVAPGLDVDARGATHLLYALDDALSLLYVTVDAAGEVTKRTITIAAASTFERFRSASTIVAKVDQVGNVHTLLTLEGNNMSGVPNTILYGIIRPNADAMSTIPLANSATAAVTMLSPIVIY